MIYWGRIKQLVITILKRELLSSLSVWKSIVKVDCQLAGYVLRCQPGKQSTTQSKKTLQKKIVSLELS